jgi:hypothetical protein
VFLKRGNLTKSTLLTLLHYVVPRVVKMVSRVVKMVSRVVKMLSRVDTHSTHSTQVRRFFIFPRYISDDFFVGSVN